MKQCLKKGSEHFNGIFSKFLRKLEENYGTRSCEKFIRGYFNAYNFTNIVLKRSLRIFPNLNIFLEI